jgi:kynureninase
VSIRFPRADDVADRLNELDIVCDYRPNSGIRISPHFYTTDEEIDAAFEVLDDVRLQKGA